MSSRITPWGGYAFCLFTIACGLGCHAIVMATNYAQGLSFGQDFWSRNIYGFGSLAIDFVGVGVCSAWAGYHRRNGEWFQAKKAMGWVVASGLFSLTMFYAYGAANRIEPTRQAALRHSAELTAQVKSEEASRAARQTILGGLMNAYGQATETALKKNANVNQRSAAGIQQQSLLAQVPDLTAVEIKAAPVEETPDPGAAVLATRINWQIASVQELWSLVFAGILLGLSSALIRRGVQNWPRLTPPRTMPPERYLQPYRPLSKPILTLVPNGVSQRGLPVLEVLRREQRPMTNVELTHLTGASKSETSRRVASLKKLGLVKTQRCGRTVQITLVPAPRAKLSTYFRRSETNESAVKMSPTAMVSMAV